MICNLLGIDGIPIPSTMLSYLGVIFFVGFVILLYGTAWYKSKTSKLSDLKEQPVQE